MDEYVIVLHPNNDIVLGVNENRPEREHVIQIEERYERFNQNGNKIILFCFFVILFLMAGTIYV